MIISRPAFNIRSIVETIVTLIITLLFFLVFLGILFSVFPIGTGLGQGNNGSSFNIMTNAVRDMFLLKDGKEKSIGVTDNTEYTAILTQTVNTVRNKRKDSVNWGSASVGAGLFEGDSVLTEAGSKALITFDEKNFLNVGEKSLVVISRLLNDDLLSQRKAVAVMAEGEIWGRIEKSSDLSTYLEISTPNADTKIRGSSGQLGATEFKINVNPDKTSSFVVYSGAIEIQSGDESFVVHENQQITIDEDSNVSAPLSLSNAVALNLPRNNRRYYYRDLPPRINFRWQRTENIENYRVLISPDSGFQKTAVDTYVYDSAFAYGNLRPGTYYWRVIAKDKDGVEGQLGEIRKVHLTRDRKPPPLHVKFPGNVVSHGDFSLAGLTEPGALVYVNEKQINVRKNGEFSKKLKLKPGVNLIVVEALDAAGNIAYQSHVVNGKFRVD